MIILATIYSLFFGLLLLAKNRGVNRIVDKDGKLVCAAALTGFHVAGLFILGLLPFVLLDGPVVFPGNRWPLAPTVISLFLFLLALWLPPALARRQAQNPSAAGPEPTAAYLASYFLVRMLFIAAYEVWFRGFLLQYSVAHLGIPMAVVLNGVLYTLLHAVNDKKELLLCIPFGGLLCGLCIWQGALWPAVLIHLALTISYELTLVRKRLTKTILYERSDHRRFGLYRS